MTNRATKKKRVGHSIFASACSSGIRVTSSPIAAPVSATVAGSTPSSWWTKKARTVPIRTGTVRRSSSRVADRGGGVELHHERPVLRLDLQLFSVEEIEAADHDREGDDDDRREVDDELVERQARWRRR